VSNPCLFDREINQSMIGFGLNFLPG